MLFEKENHNIWFDVLLDLLDSLQIKRILSSKCIGTEFHEIFTDQKNKKKEKEKGVKIVSLCDVMKFSHLISSLCLFVCCLVSMKGFSSL